MKKTFSGAFMLSLLLLASHSHAYALIDLNVGGKGEVQTQNASSSAQVELRSNAQATSSNSSSKASQEGMVTVSRNSLEANTEASVETFHEAVLTNADLKAYASTALRGDDNLEEMNFTGEAVEVSYKERGRFLALVPVTFSAKAVAKADGSVELDYPWYAFLTLDDQEQIKTDLKIAVDNALKARAVGSVTAEGERENPRFTASESAEVAAEMHAILRSGLEAEEEIEG